MMSFKFLALVASLAMALPVLAGAATITATDATAFAGKGVVGDRGAAGNALGVADGKFLSLGLGGAAVFSFGQAFTGPISVLEVTYNRVGYLETARVFAGNLFAAGTSAFRMADFTEIGTIGNAAPVATLSFTGTYRYLALLDTSPRRAGRDGYDVDSITVSGGPAATIAPAPVPLPASALLLALGIGAFGAARRWRKA